MSVSLRSVTPDEFDAFARTDSVAFGFTMSATDLETEKAALEFDRTLAAFEGPRIVGTTAALSLDLTLPGGAILPAGGLTWTSVLPTHRRRGVLTELIRQQLRQCLERGEPLGILLASEAVIYGRFGYGPATHEAGFSISTAEAGFRREVEGLGTAGRFRVLEPEETQGVLTAAFDRLRPEIPGSVGRSERLWTSHLADAEHHRDGASGMMHVIHEDPHGDVDGYLTYRIKSDWPGGIPQSVLVVDELVAPGPDAHAALWRYCLEMDLVAHVRAECVAPDEPLRWLLGSPRHLRPTHLNDGLWVRILDVSTALSARGYQRAATPSGDDALVFEVADSFYGRVGDRYLLEAGPAGATCVPTTAPADLALEISELGAAYLGAADFTSLVRARRVRELTPGAAARADSLFRAQRAPWCCTHF